jgi:anti-sigma B factor antagonist
MRVESQRREGVLRLSLVDGDALDTHSAPQVKLQARRLIDGSADLVIDLSCVEFVDSVGLGVLVGLFKAARALGCRTCFVGIRPGVRRVMEIIRLDEIFDLRFDVETSGAAAGTAARGG